MEQVTAEFATTLFVVPSGEWIFVSVPPDVSQDIREVSRPPRKGFGSVRVEVTIGGTTWNTSVFPDSASGCYMLPVKKAVREAEGLEIGDDLVMSLTTLD